MKKNEIDYHNKYNKINGIMQFNFLNISEKIKVQIQFLEHSFIIKIIKTTIKQDIIDKIFNPIKKIANCYIINYTLIKDIFISESIIKLFINNLKTLSIISITLSKLETNGKIFNSKISIEGLKILIYKIKYSIIREMKYLKDLISTMIDLLDDCSNEKKSSNPIVEEILFQSYIIGREFYDKYMIELKKNMKIKETIQKNVLEQIEIFQKEEISPYYSDLNDFSLNNINIESNNPTCEISNNNSTVENGNNNINNNSNTYDLMMNQFKTKTTKNISESIKLFFIILQNDSNELDRCDFLRQKTISFHANNFQKTYFNQNLIYHLNKIPTFNQYIDNNFDEQKSSKTGKNFVKRNIKNDNFNKTEMNLEEIIEKCCRKHSFLPPNDSFNIFFNTTEIIQRKFFELFFNEFIGDIFEFQRDNDNLIKLDSLYQIFVCIRRLKKVIFMENNNI
jgi:hypothetical protein